MTVHCTSRIRTGYRQGSAAIEFALLGPLLVVLLAGMVVYGGWFWMAQSVQSLASESARAAVAGLDATERDQLARSFVTLGAKDIAGVDPSKVAVTVVSDTDAIRVEINYDMTGHPLLALAGLLPSPPTLIKRSAIVRIGGY